VTDAQRLRLVIWLNAAAVIASVGLVWGAFGIQVFQDEAPCPLCLLQRLGFFAIAAGGLMNLRFGVRPGHYGITLLGALVVVAVSLRQISLHACSELLTGQCTGYGTAPLGWHLYTWALVTFVIAVVGCSFMLLWNKPFLDADSGIAHQRRWLRVIALTAIIWVFLDLIVMGISVIPECGVGMCPDDPPNITGAGDIGGWLIVLATGMLAFAIAAALVLNNKVLRTER
jgi:disulfide bond formation protein DsbB